MLEILQFYVSGFWIWLGTTIGMMAAAGAAGQALGYIAALVRR